MARPTLRSFLFWPHLASGLLAGLLVAVMSFTGLALAFAPQLLAASDREAREVALPAPGTPRLGVDALVERVKAERPGLKVTGVTVYPQPSSAVLVASGRTGGVYVNPYTGELRDLGAQGLRKGLHAMEDWHRWLGAEGDGRPVGKAFTGAGNALFLFLALSGLYLWWPRRWTRAALRSTSWFRGGLRGKARDFNWHNVIGFWLLPVLIVLTASGLVISYKWASSLVYTLTGSPAPAGPGGPPGAGAAPQRSPAAPAAAPLALEAMFARATQQVPAWESVSLRLAAPGGAPQQPAGGARAAPGARAGAQPSRGSAAAAEAQPGRDATAPAGARTPRGEAQAARGPQPLTFTVREPDAWPRFATLSLTLDPVSGEVLKREGYADGTLGRRVRTWLRFLHTGEALGLPGQAVAALGCLGGLFLVWTGFALAWRRFFPRRQQQQPQAPATPLPEAAAQPASETSAA